MNNQMILAIIGTILAVLGVSIPLFFAGTPVGSSSTTNVNSTAGVVVTQGDKITTQDSHAAGRITINPHCTVSFVENGKAWTAAHCGDTNDVMYDSRGVAVGVLKKFSPDGAYDPGSDLAYVELYDTVQSGGNKFNAVKAQRSFKYGDQVCMFSRMKNQELCGEVDLIVGGVVSPWAKIAGVHIVPGDSGGPAWIPGVGVVGVISGYSPNSGALVASFQ